MSSSSAANKGGSELSNDLIAQREDFYRDIHARNVEALWNAKSVIAQNEPVVQSVPFIWRWKEMRPRILRAGDLVTAHEAERRVLMLINPSYEAKTLRTVGSIYAGIQMVLPGECAGSHRHTPSAQRFVIEGDGAYTTVDGERTVMSKGDYVTTPKMAWHDHGNNSKSPMMWLDGLDIPFVNILDANFFEDHEDETQKLSKQEEDSHYRWSRNLHPTWESPESARTPLLNYRWKTARETLHHLRNDVGSSYDGIILEYINPLTGRSTLPTMSAYLQLLRKGEHTEAHRHTSSTVYHVAEGAGKSIISGKEFLWEEGDTFVVPSWAPHEHQSEGGEAVLFSYSDRPVLKAFGLLREKSIPRQ